MLYLTRNNYSVILKNTLMNKRVGMKKIWVFSFLAIIIAGCRQHGVPDVSNIQVNIQVARFDKFMFEKADTNSIQQGLANLQASFPYFTGDFVTNILGLPPVRPGSNDSSAMATLSELKHFIRITRPLYDSLAPKFEEMSSLEKELTNGFKYVKYYFPGYKIPAVVAFVGPFNSPGIAITSQALAIGLQLYAGKDFSYYTSEQGMEIFPMYISRTFEPQYIPVNAMKAVGEDIFPDKSAGKPLIDQMIEKGKQWWLLNKLLPNTPDSLKTGYTKQQLNWCLQNEGLIWNFFLQNNDLYSTEPALIKDYIGESPTTQGMPEDSPGNIGQWIGWQIVQKYEAKNPDLTPQEIMKTDPRKIFSETKYKPR